MELGIIQKERNSCDPPPPLHLGEHIQEWPIKWTIQRNGSSLQLANKPGAFHLERRDAGLARNFKQKVVKTRRLWGAKPFVCLFLFLVRFITL